MKMENDEPHNTHMYIQLHPNDQSLQKTTLTEIELLSSGHLEFTVTAMH